MYNCLIIGAGKKGALSDAPGTGNEEKYLSYAHALTDHPDTDLLGFIDTDFDAQIKAEDTWGVKTSEAYNRGVDIVVISTPDNVHHISLLQALLFKPKLVICEKPLCLQTHMYEIQEIYAAANIPILVNYTRRFIPHWQEIKAKISEYGDFRSGYLYYNRGRLHTASHFIDLCLWLGITDFSKIQITEIAENYQWVFDWSLFYEKDFISEKAVDIKTTAVPSIYDQSIYNVIDNAIGFLNEGQPLKCTIAEAIEAINQTNNME